MRAIIGHNSGHVLEPGHSWRKHVWTKARKDLLPVLPVEVVRTRVRRAAELGLPYRTYAGFRATTGHDLIGFLFSSNALRVLRDGQDLPADRTETLTGLKKTTRIGLAHRPVTPTHLGSLAALDHAFAAPAFADSWGAMRDQVCAVFIAQRQSGDRFVMVGDTAFEREWAEAGKMAGYLPAAQFFAR
ncbi:hypothetical protein [Yoonia sp.]|uniref:hypothetical protein n=1 Tax=Yoonia sp. TaxID=2212373 RepID=UPI003F4A93BC